MDNPNDPNSSTNLNPTSPLGAPQQTSSDLPNFTTPMPTTPTQPQPPAEPAVTPTSPFPSPSSSWSTAPEPVMPASEPTAAPVSPPWPPAPDTNQTNLDTASSVPSNPGADLGSAWTPPTSPPASVQPEPLSSQNSSAWTPPAPSGLEPLSPPEPTQTSTLPLSDLPLAEPTPAQPEPTPTFTPAPATPAAGTNEPSSVTPPLSSPWGTTPAAPVQPSWMNTQTPGTPPISPTEAAPTDLSHLISNNQPEVTSMPTAESLSMPSTGIPEVPNLPTETHKGVPKWLIGLGLGLLIIVLGASAYFIMGIGQQSKGITSLPAVTTPQVPQVKPPLPIATVSAQPSPTTATSSSSFGQLEGTPTATSAADLIRQRLQQQRK